MSSASIFRSLRELFPQVDMRILRAISIEHEEDINEAIEFILSEVLLASNTTPGVSFILHDTGKSEQELRERDNEPEHITIPDGKPISPFGTWNYIGEAESRVLESTVADGDDGPEHITIPHDKPVSPFGTQSYISGTENRGLDSLVANGDNEPEHITIPDDKPVSPLGTQNYIGRAENRGLDSLVADVTNGFVLGQPYFMFSDADSTTEPGHEESISNNRPSLNLNQLSEKEDDNFLYKSHNQNDVVESLLDGGSEKIILTEHFTKFAKELECVHMDLHSDTEELFKLRDEESISVQLDEQINSSAVFDKCENPMEYGFEEQNEVNIQLNVCNDLSESSDQCRPLNLHDLETVVYRPSVLTSLHILSDGSEKNQHYWDPTAETNKNALDNENHNSFSLDVNCLEISLDENILPVSLATRSGHAVTTDVLEDSIKDAKSSKKSLVSSLESMVNMMREVELLEEKADQAKEEALVAGHHTLCKVEELQQIVKKSKDENDMQSGQVYGERSILSTEARELQSRLVQMSEERSKYLSVIEEISKALEVRQSAAKEVIAAADIEKREKEEVALKALKELELLRDAVVAESQKLDQEAEENFKLREFLMDRGHAVDSLQGEIAIICEDILTLKRRVDGCIPLTKSLMSSSSFTKSLMLSFSSSSGSSANSSDHNGGRSSSSSHPTYKETHEKHQEEENATVFLNKLGTCSNPLDDWELCEK